MGKRYRLIVEALGLKTRIFDEGSVIQAAVDNFGIIDASPTYRRLLNFPCWNCNQTPILAEKPFFRNGILPEVINTTAWPKRLRMINQYEYFLAERELNGIKDMVAVQTHKETIYDYFKSGGDGVIWDCINIIGLADDDSDLHLANDSLIWKCKINNINLDISKMDTAYIWNVYDWLTHLDSNKEYFIKAHQKCLELYRDATNSDSNSG
jgi:hypothetical protein